MENKEIEKEYFTKQEVDDKIANLEKKYEDLLNSKIVNTFGEVMKSINQPKEEKVEPKQKTTKDFYF